MTDPNGVDDATRTAIDELNRQRRLIDQGLTMQAALRDRDRTIGTGLICAILCASLVGVAFAFAGGGQAVTLLGITANRATWIGWLSVATAGLTLVELVLDRRGAAQHRDDAVRALGALKSEYRTPPVAGQEVAEAARMGERYMQVMETIPPIPERLFNRLKAKHLRKVEVSKALSTSPGISVREARRRVAKHNKQPPTG